MISCVLVPLDGSARAEQAIQRSATSRPMSLNGGGLLKYRLSPNDELSTKPGQFQGSGVVI